MKSSQGSPFEFRASCSYLSTSRNLVFQWLTWDQGRYSEQTITEWDQMKMEIEIRGKPTQAKYEEHVKPFRKSESS